MVHGRLTMIHDRLMMVHNFYDGSWFHYWFMMVASLSMNYFLMTHQSIGSSDVSLIDHQLVMIERSTNTGHASW